MDLQIQSQIPIRYPIYDTKIALLASTFSVRPLHIFTCIKKAYIEPPFFKLFLYGGNSAPAYCIYKNHRREKNVECKIPAPAFTLPPATHSFQVTMRSTAPS